MKNAEDENNMNVRMIVYIEDFIIEPNNKTNIQNLPLNVNYIPRIKSKVESVVGTYTKTIVHDVLYRSTILDAKSFLRNNFIENASFTNIFEILKESKITDKDNILLKLAIPVENPNAFLYDDDSDDRVKTRLGSLDWGTLYFTNPSQTDRKSRQFEVTSIIVKEEGISKLSEYLKPQELKLDVEHKITKKDFLQKKIKRAKKDNLEK